MKRQIRVYQDRVTMAGRVGGLLLLWAALFVLWGGFMAGPVQAEEFGILSETYLYPDGVVLDKDSKLQTYFNVKIEDDFADKREGIHSLKGYTLIKNWWFGFGVKWGPDDAEIEYRDMSAYRNGSLNFWVKTETPLKIGIKDSAEKESWANINVPSDNQWQFISIPLDNDHFNIENKISKLDFTEITHLFMISDGIDKPQSNMLKFHLDNVRWNTEAIDHTDLQDMVISSGTFTIPSGLPKSFSVQGRDSGGRAIDVYPTWSVVQPEAGGFIINEGPIGIFEAGTLAGTYTIKANYKDLPEATVDIHVEDAAWNDSFDIFVDEGVYDTLGLYVSDSRDLDGDGEEDNRIEVEAVTDEHPSEIETSLRAEYTIKINGRAGLFFQEGEPLIINQDMEIGTHVPIAWTTFNNDIGEPAEENGWVGDIYRSKDHSLKIVNTSGGDAYWLGRSGVLSEPYPTKVAFAGWAKAENVSEGVTAFRLKFHIYFQDDTDREYLSDDLNFKKGTHDWHNVHTTVEFGKPIKKIEAYCQLSGGTGTAWFDDVYVFMESPVKTKDISRFKDENNEGYLHFYVKTPVDLIIGATSGNIYRGTEASRVLLSDYGIELDGGRWQEVYIPLDDFKIRDKRLSFSQVNIYFSTTVIGALVGGGDLSNNFYLSDIRYTREKAARTPTLGVAVKEREGGGDVTEITWSDPRLGQGWKIAAEYLKVTYDTSHPYWGIQIYTENLEAGVFPRYGGDPTISRVQQPVGLIGEDNSLINCPMAWMVLDDTNENIPVPVEKENEYSRGDPEFAIYFMSDKNGIWGEEANGTRSRNEWCWLKDKYSTRWDDKNSNGMIDLPDDGGGYNVDPDYELVPDFPPIVDEYSTFISSKGIGTGWYDPKDKTKRVYILNPVSPIIIYFAADFTIAKELQKYTTSTITLELYHEEEGD